MYRLEEQWRNRKKIQFFAETIKIINSVAARPSFPQPEAAIEIRVMIIYNECILECAVLSAF